MTTTVKKLLTVSAIALALCVLGMTSSQVHADPDPHAQWVHMCQMDGMPEAMGFDSYSACVRAYSRGAWVHMCQMDGMAEMMGFDSYSACVRAYRR
jgi:hypothetical protein